MGSGHLLCISAGVLLGWAQTQVVWLGNGHKAVTVQGPRRPLLRSVLCSILILGLLPPPPGVDQPLTSSPPSPTTGLKRPGCSQNCSSFLSLLLPARTSIFAKRESPTLRTEGTTMSTLGSRPSLTSLRQNQRKPVPKGQR